jgi:hypothetical protein
MRRGEIPARVRSGRRLGAGLLCLLIAAAVLAAPAGAREVRLPQPHLGSFTEPRGLAFDQKEGDVYAIDGRSEIQQVTIAATAGQFRLKFGASETTDLSFNAAASQVRDALRTAICPGKECVVVLGGPGDASGSTPYRITFVEVLATTDVELLVCLPGTAPLSGGSGCSVATSTPGVNGAIARYHANGSPANFSALGSNVIDGRGGPDKVEPSPGGLQFNERFEEQVAIDESSGTTKGEIYATQFGDHLVDIFSEAGEFKGQLREYEQTPGNPATLAPLKEVCGVAIDSAGDVYVADFLTGIHKYHPSGDPVKGADTVANFNTVSFPCTLAAGSGATAGSLFADGFLNGLFRLDATSGELVYKVSEGNTTVSVDPVGGHVFSAAGSEVKEFDASGASPALLGSIEAGSAVSGVTVDGSSGLGGSVFVARAGVTHLDIYGPLVKMPVIEAKAPGSIGATSAVLKGTVSAEGGPPASCHFEYLNAATYLKQREEAGKAVEPESKEEVAEAAFAGAQSVACEPAGPFAGAAVNQVTGKVEGLTSETEYEFRLVGTNENGALAGAPEGFVTFGRPAVEGGTASQVTATSALITGAVNPRGSETEVAVQYVARAQYEGEASKFEAATVVAGPTLPAEVTGAGDLGHATGIGVTVAGSTTLFDLTTATGVFEPGQTITGPGIPPETTVVKESDQAGGLVLSKQATASATNVSVIGTSDRVANLTTAAGRFGAGQAISGPGIPPGTTVLSAQAGQLTLSNAATERVLGTALVAFGAEPVAVELTGLTPDTPYIFRLTAQSASGPGEPQGLAHGFATAVPAGPALPDGRVYEMVTPPQKEGEPYIPASEPREGLGGSCRFCTPGTDRERMPMQATADGDGLAFEGSAMHGGLAPAANEYVARRGAGGWGSVALGNPSYRDDTEKKTGFKALSGDLRRAVVQQSSPALTGQAPEGFANLYLQEEGNPTLQTMITSEPEHRATEGSNVFRVNYAGANAGGPGAEAFTHVIFQANDALTGEEPGLAPAAPAVTAEGRDLYEYSEGRLHLVNVLPGNAAAAPNAVIGSGRLLKEVGTETLNFDFAHAISSDGSRVFWSAAPSGQVYVREDGTSTTEIPDHAGRFLTATPDGAKVLLSDGKVYDLEDETLSDLTEGRGGFQGIAGTSEDLSRVYFIDTEELGGEGQTGEPNLYLWEEGETSHAGTTRFIATLLATDNKAGGAGELGVWHAAPGERLAQATPDGRFLAFESTAPLTGFDNTIAGGVGCRGGSEHKGAPACFEVFEYDAQSRTLACSSCNPREEAPLGQSNLSLMRGEEEFMSEPQNLPARGEGRLFFESQDRLVQGDSNGAVQDVYEWEPDGVGGCTRVGGCVALISSGRSSSDSSFLASDATGANVFFTARDRLVGADKDDFLDVYDARVDGGFPSVTEPAVCQGEGCLGALGEPPLFGAPASATFTGLGNFAAFAPVVVGPRVLTRAQKLTKALRACHAKHNRRKRTACERQARRRYGPPSKSKSVRKGGK